MDMKVRSKFSYTATQYNKWGDHPNEYRNCNGIPIVPVEEGKAPTWGKNERLLTIDECAATVPENMEYSIFATKGGRYEDGCWRIVFGNWILERGGKVVGVLNSDEFNARFEVDSRD